MVAPESAIGKSTAIMADGTGCQEASGARCKTYIDDDRNNPPGALQAWAFF
jgi:hypothetical protein